MPQVSHLYNGGQNDKFYWIFVIFESADTLEVFQVAPGNSSINVCWFEGLVPKKGNQQSKFMCIQKKNRVSYCCL